MTGPELPLVPGPRSQRAKAGNGADEGAGRNQHGFSLPLFSRMTAAPSPVESLGCLFCRLRGSLYCLPRPFFRLHLLLHLERDGVSVHLIRGGGITKHYGRVGAR